MSDARFTTAVSRTAASPDTLTRPTVLVLIEWFLPGEKAGGPVRTLAATLDRLGDRARFRVVTRDRDLGDRRPYEDVRAGVWTQLGRAEVRHLARHDESLRAIARLLRTTKWDVLYINTLYSAPFSLYPLLLAKLHLIARDSIVVAPRGQLDLGALAIRRRKKVAFLRLARVARLYSGVTWQATSADEAANIARWFGVSAQVVVAPNLHAPIRTAAAEARIPASTLRVAFISRISEKKNLVGALEILSTVRAEVDFSIYGPLEDEAYWARCRALMDALPANVHARYRGVLPFSAVHDALAAHDLLLFPTHGENFGHVIAEALAAGCPPLISDRTPWRGLIDRGAGWDLPLEDAAAFAAVLDQVAAESHTRRQARSNAARAYAQEFDRDATVVERTAALFGLPAAAD